MNYSFYATFFLLLSSVACAFVLYCLHVCVPCLWLDSIQRTKKNHCILFFTCPACTQSAFCFDFAIDFTLPVLYAFCISVDAQQPNRDHRSTVAGGRISKPIRITCTLCCSFCFSFFFVLFVLFVLFLLSQPYTTRPKALCPGRSLPY